MRQHHQSCLLPKSTWRLPFPDCAAPCKERLCSHWRAQVVCCCIGLTEYIFLVDTHCTHCTSSCMRIRSIYIVIQFNIEWDFAEEFLHGLSSLWMKFPLIYLCFSPTCNFCVYPKDLLTSSVSSAILDCGKQELNVPNGCCTALGHPV